LRKIVCDIFARNQGDRIYDDVAVVHSIATASPDVRTCPDTDAASDSAAPNALTEPLGELHRLNSLLRDQKRSSCYHRPAQFLIIRRRSSFRRESIAQLAELLDDEFER